MPDFARFSQPVSWRQNSRIKGERGFVNYLYSEKDDAGVGGRLPVSGRMFLLTKGQGRPYIVRAMNTPYAGKQFPPRENDSNAYDKAFVSSVFLRSPNRYRDLAVPKERSRHSVCAHKNPI